MSGFKSPWLFLILPGLAFAVGLRFTNLGMQEFYHDEAAGLMLTLGHSPQDLRERLALEGPLPAGEIFKNLQLSETSSYSALLKAFAGFDPLHPPLFYILNRAWLGLAGDSPAAARFLPSLFGLLCVPAIGALALAFSGSRRAGQWAAALATVAPFLFLHAISAREYSLWIFLATMMQVSLLRGRWTAYVAFAVLSFYTSLLTLPLLAAGLLWTRKWKTHFALGLMCLPWVLVIFYFRQAAGASSDWMSGGVTPFQYFSSVGASFYKIFFDWDLRQSPGLVAFSPLLLALLGLAAAGTVQIVRHRYGRLVLGFSLLSTFGRDLLTGGHAAMSPRYHAMIFVLILTGAVWWLVDRPVDKRRIPNFVLLALLVCGVSSVFKITQARTWWNKTYDGSLFETAERAEPGKILISHDVYDLVAASRYLNPEFPLGLGPGKMELTKK